MGVRAVATVAVLLTAISGGAIASLQVVDDRRAAVVRAEAAAARLADRTAAQVRRDRGGTVGFQDPAGGTRTAVSSARPTRVLIPSIHVNADLERLARDSRGVLQAPLFADEAGWWSGGVVPGQVGPAIIVGHLDTIQGPAAFVDLRRLRPGDLIEVRMSDGRTVRFAVDGSHVVDKALFPSRTVYGATPDAQLRLITCSEPFDPVLHSYTDNLVVFATEV